MNALYPPRPDGEQLSASFLYVVGALGRRRRAIIIVAGRLVSLAWPSLAVAMGLAVPDARSSADGVLDGIFAGLFFAAALADHQRLCGDGRSAASGACLADPSLGAVGAKTVCDLGSGVAADGRPVRQTESVRTPAGGDAVAGDAQPEGSGASGGVSGLGFATCRPDRRSGPGWASISSPRCRRRVSGAWPISKPRRRIICPGRACRCC